MAILTGTTEYTIADITDAQRDHLQEWAYLASVKTVADGGIGQTAVEARRAHAAWHALDNVTQAAHAWAVSTAIADAVVEIERMLDDLELLRPTCTMLLGDDYALLSYLSTEEKIDLCVQAVEHVVDALSERGHEDLAQAVAVALDPDPPTEAERAEIALAVRQMLRDMPSA